MKKSSIKNILISQPPPENEKSPYSKIIEKYKIHIDFIKFFTIEGIPAKDFRKDKININEFESVIFTSKNAIDHYFRIAQEIRFQVPETMKYFCTSEAIAYYLQKYVVFRKRKIFHSKVNHQELIEIIKKHKTDKFLFPCSEMHKDEIPAMLEQNNINYSNAVIYKTVDKDLKDLDLKKYDLMAFFSPSGIKSLLNNFPNFKQNSKHIATFGKTTAEAAKEASLKISIEAPTPAAPSMAMAIEQFLAKNA